MIHPPAGTLLMVALTGFNESWDKPARDREREKMLWITFAAAYYFILLRTMATQIPPFENSSKAFLCNSFLIFS